MILRATKVAYGAGPILQKLTGIPVSKWTDESVRKLISEAGQAVGRNLDGTWKGTAVVISLKFVSATS